MHTTSKDLQGMSSMYPTASGFYTFFLHSPSLTTREKGPKPKEERVMTANINIKQ